MANHAASLQGGMTSSCGLSIVKQKMQFIVRFVGTFRGANLEFRFVRDGFKNWKFTRNALLQK
jgi:hypothetical protein